MGLPAGRLRHRVSIEALVSGLDSDGATEEEWVDQVGRLLPAEIVALSGRELVAAQAAHSEVVTRIRIRYRPGVTASMRVVHRGTAYDIAAVVQDPDSGRRWLTLHCKSGVNAG
jgi:SPP1 family predicted phage head-tail adaptor